MKGGKKRRFLGGDSFGLLSSPVYGIAIIMLLTLGIVLLPGEDLGKLLLGEGGTDARNLGNTLYRVIGAAAIILLTLNMGLKTYDFSGLFSRLAFALPFVLVVVNNLPIIGLATGDVTVNAGAGSWVIFAFYCLSVGLFEESVFRGIVFPLVLSKMGKDRKGVFWSVVISSALFGALHLVNLFSSAPLPVILQIGYSFLIGAMCAIIMLITRNAAVCALFHAVFNFCGLMADTLGGGMKWTVAPVILTAAVGVLAALYGLWLLLRKLPPENAALLYPENKPKETTDA